MLPDYVKIKDIKPVINGYIRESLIMLNAGGDPDEKTVHDVRVLMKKARAVMKLLRNQTDESFFAKEYGTFREVGRKMRDWRETSVHRKTLKNLRKNHPEIFVRLRENEKVNRLIRKPLSVETPVAENREKLEYIISQLRKSGFRLRFRNLNNLDPQLLLKELDLTYTNLAGTYLMARNYTNPSNLHEFRKKSKDFMYQLYFFRSLKPRTIKVLEKRLDSMTQNLGKYNDLAVLTKTLGYKYDPKGFNEPALDELVVLIRNEQDKYLAKVWPEAYASFCPGQKLFSLLGYKILII